MNELGNVGIDNEVVIANSDTMAERNDGCLCWSINGELQQAVHRVLK